jgi:hypothetical protein
MVGRLSTLQTQLLFYYKSSLVTALLGVAFGHPDLQTAHYPTYFYGNSSNKQSIRIIHEFERTETHYKKTAVSTDP